MKVVKSTKKPENDFLTISKKILKDKRVTDKARGFFLTIMSLNPTWDYSIAGLCTLFPADRDRSKRAGREQIYKRLKELMETGYVAREPSRGQQGTIEDWVYFFDPDGDAESLLTVKPEVVKPDMVQPQQVFSDTIEDSYSIVCDSVGGVSARSRNCSRVGDWKCRDGTTALSNLSMLRMLRLG